MILTGDAIEKAVSNGQITISPFDASNLSTNAYDFHLGTRLITYENEVLDVRHYNPYTVSEMPPDGVVLQPARLYLINTEERIGSNHFVPIIRGRSSIGRLGIFVHITADLIDLGSINQLTLQLHVVQPVRVFPGMRIGQATFWKTRGRRLLYKGKYGNRSSPCASLAHTDEAK